MCADLAPVEGYVVYTKQVVILVNRCLQSRRSALGTGVLPTSSAQLVCVSSQPFFPLRHAAKPLPLTRCRPRCPSSIQRTGASGETDGAIFSPNPLASSLATTCRRNSSTYAATKSGVSGAFSLSVILSLPYPAVVVTLPSATTFFDGYTRRRSRSSSRKEYSTLRGSKKDIFQACFGFGLYFVVYEDPCDIVSSKTLATIGCTHNKRMIRARCLQFVPYHYLPRANPRVSR